MALSNFTQNNTYISYRLGSTIYSFIYFARAIAANIGIVASSLILPHFGWFGCFIFFGALTIFSFILLLVFNEKPIPKDKNTQPEHLYQYEGTDEKNPVYS